MADAVTTGIGPLDSFLKGGLPRGFTTLLLAPAGAGAEIFAKQFSSNHPNERGVYVTTDESTREVSEAVAASGWDFSQVQVIDIQTLFAEAMMEAQQKARPQASHDSAPAPKSAGRFDPRDLVEHTSSLDFLHGTPSGLSPRNPNAPQSAPTAEVGNADYLGRLLDPFQRLRTPDRMVVHSLDFFLNLYTPEQVVAALTALKAANSKGGGLLLLVLTKGAHGGTIERRLELLADCLIELEVSRKGTTFERFFMVKKVKNRSYGIGVSTYDVTPGGFVLETLERIV